MIYQPVSRKGAPMEDPAIISANIRRYEELIESGADPDTRERARKLLAEARAALAARQRVDRRD